MAIGTILDWQKNSESLRVSLPAGVVPSPPGYYQLVDYKDVPTYTDPGNPRGSQYYGTQKVAVPVLGTLPSGIRYYPSFDSFGTDGGILWEFSEPHVGTPPIPWEPRLDPQVALDIAIGNRPATPVPPRRRESLWTRFWRGLMGSDDNRDRFTGS